MGRDSSTFQDKGTEVPSLFKGSTGQAQNLAKGPDGSGNPVKIQDGTRDGTIQESDSPSCPFPSSPLGQNRTDQKRMF